jgi:hypothetical protein
MTTAPRANEAQPLLRRERPSAAARATRASLVAVAIAAVLAAVAVAGVSSRFNNVLASSSLGSLDAALGDAGAPARSLHVGARGHSRFHAARLGEEDAEPIIPRASAPEPADDPDSDDDARAMGGFRATALDPARFDAFKEGVSKSFHAYLTDASCAADDDAKRWLDDGFDATLTRARRSDDDPTATRFELLMDVTKPVQARSSIPHWFPYDRVDVVNADP